MCLPYSILPKTACPVKSASLFNWGLELKWVKDGLFGACSGQHLLKIYWPTLRNGFKYNVQG